MSDQEQPKSQAADPRKLYVSNLDPTASNRKTESDLQEIFSKFGQVLSINVKRNEKYNKLYAFILFKNASDAAEALSNLDNEYFGDTKMRVELQKGPRGQGARRQGNPSNAVTCFRCRKVGHFARECNQKIQRSSDYKRERPDRRERSRRHRSRDRKSRESRSSSNSSSRSSSSEKKHRRRRRSRSSSSSSSSESK